MTKLRMTALALAACCALAGGATGWTVGNAAAATLSLGPRVGYADMEGDLLSGDAAPGEYRIFGVQVVAQLSPGFAVEVAGEAVSDEFEFEDVETPGALVDGKAKWDDLGLFASIHLGLLDLGPLRAYAGGGAGLHFNQVEVLEVATSVGGREQSGTVPAGTNDLIDDFLDDVEQERDDAEWHALGGLAWDWSGVPLSIFAEARYRNILQDSGDVKGWAAYGGLNLRLE
ncbi:MAG: hypothetical protein IT349_09705 [Candidatus Eisenbacteria bacterium]|nr:hypothetical protein [Candidatus Eisenbacteria bacterium]